MARKARSLRDGVPAEFLMALADNFEQSGADTLLACLQTDPEVFWDLARRTLSPGIVSQMPDDPRSYTLPQGRFLLQVIAGRAAAGIRTGTVAEGKPPRGRLI